MNSVETIEDAVRNLPPAELALFRRWFESFDAASWDRQIEADALGGKLEALAAEALAEHRAGMSREV